MQSQRLKHNTQNAVSDTELRQVIADFLAMGHVDNILAMFRQEPRYNGWVSELLLDERFAVRLGLAVLYEQLVIERPPEELHLALESLRIALQHEQEWVRGEAVNLLGILGTQESHALVQTLADDPSPQVREVVQDVLAAADHE
ncbi:MAG: PBS lyase [Desulfobulbus propionicus]|nr:MAG: PBS lyase [Desulfobulbus propionicus]